MVITCDSISDEADMSIYRTDNQSVIVIYY